LTAGVGPRPSRAGPAGALRRDGCCRIDSRVVLGGFLGNANRYSVRVGDLRFLVSTDANTHFAAGAAYRWALMPRGRRR
jgi:hypothetical protein